MATLRSIEPSHYSTLAAHIRANTDPEVVAALAIRDDDTIRDWYNTATVTDAWRNDVDRLALFEMTPITAFDGLSAGKRDAWRLMLEQAAMVPFDFGRSKPRSVVRDIWSVAQADTILTACIRKATRCEMVFGGTVESSGSLSATDLLVSEWLASYTISTILNQF
jgi:hypothetical protein